MNRRGVITVISGFSGAGKGTVVRELTNRYGYAVSISATTRAPRNQEVDGVHYFFKTNKEFEEMIERDEFMEYAGYVDHYYGTPKDYVMQKLEQGVDVILEIEMQGALQVKERFPEAVLVFITTPSYARLEHQLFGRGTEAEDVIRKRLHRAAEECAYMERYDYIVVNDALDDCVTQVHHLVQSVHLESGRQKELIDQISRDFAEHAD